MKIALNIHVTGIVQGVGFRPFVFKQAKLHMINGWVCNSPDGVHIHGEGEDKNLDAFCMSLANNAPTAAKVKQIEMNETTLENFETFEIRTSCDVSGNSHRQTLVSADIATCEECAAELFDKSNKRFRYPFINCTNCGPRFTIINSLPYDRKTTSMADFKMCEHCQDEYDDLANRRFHAQPNACFDCGPHIALKANDNETIGDTLETSDQIFSECVQLLLDGKIVAVKGLGGFHLACDATNADAVARLRQKKERSNKPFAIMAPDVASIKEICEVNDIEKRLLTGSVRPIVLLKRKAKSKIADDVFMGLSEIGVMLPYTPVQHILMHDFSKAGGKYLVMTSGNVYDNPIIIDDDEAFEVLGDIADAILGNNRQIVARYDDSVVRVIKAGDDHAIQTIRRARGYCPEPLNVTLGTGQNDTIFATGPQQKNTFAFARSIDASKSDDKANTEVFVSQHIGDMENAGVFDAWDSTRERIAQLFKLEPNHFVCDIHPNYLTTKWAKDNCNEDNLHQVQHHYAHIRSVMYENGLEGPVCGFAFDGTGYGIDGQIWGGECLLCNTKDFERFANFAYVPMPGGDACVKDADRMAYSCLWAFDLLNSEAAKNFTSKFSDVEKNNLDLMITQGINTPMTSSVGRLFDAAAALLGICDKATYEGEPAISCEAAMWEWLQNNDKKTYEYDKRYDIQITKNVGTKNSTAQDTSVLLLDPANTFTALLEDINAGKDVGLIAKTFHDAFANAILQVSLLCNQLYGIKEIALGGGVFMNRYLIETTIKLLIDNGFSVAINRELPPNDGSISLGQL